MLAGLLLFRIKRSLKLKSVSITILTKNVETITGRPNRFPVLPTPWEVEIESKINNFFSEEEEKRDGTFENLRLNNQ